MNRYYFFCRVWTSEKFFVWEKLFPLYKMRLLSYSFFCIINFSHRKNTEISVYYTAVCRTHANYCAFNHNAVACCCYGISVEYIYGNRTFKFFCNPYNGFVLCYAFFFYAFSINKNYCYGYYFSVYCSLGNH